MRTFFFILILATLLLAVGCQSRTVTGETISVGSGSYKQVTADELDTMLANKDFVLINVHIPFAGNIPGTNRSIPYDVIEQNPAKLPADKDAKIVLYCRSGRMSQIAAEELVALGYTSIWDLQGGMVEWEQAGYDIEN